MAGTRILLSFVDFALPDVIVRSREEADRNQRASLPGEDLKSYASPYSHLSHGCVLKDAH